MSNVPSLDLGEFYCGKLMSIVFTLTDAAGAPLDISAYTALTFWASLGRGPAGTTISEPLTITNGPAGEATLSRTIPTNEAPGNWTFQLIGTDDSGNPRVFAAGSYTLKEALDC